MAPVNTVHRTDRDRQQRRLISALRRNEIEIKNLNAFVTLLRITLVLASTAQYLRCAFGTASVCRWRDCDVIWRIPDESVTLQVIKIVNEVMAEAEKREPELSADEYVDVVEEAISQRYEELRATNPDGPMWVARCSFPTPPSPPWGAS